MTNQVLDIRANMFYSKNPEGEYQRHFEIVLLTDCPTYTRSNAGELIRERKVEMQRFTCDAENLKILGQNLMKISESTESDFK